MFIEALIHNDQKVETMQIPANEKLINKENVAKAYNVILFTNAFTHTTIWMNLETTMLSLKKPVTEDTYWIIPFINEMTTVGKSVEMEKQISGCLEQGGIGKLEDEVSGVYDPFLG